MPLTLDNLEAGVAEAVVHRAKELGRLNSNDAHLSLEEHRACTLIWAHRAAELNARMQKEGGQYLALLILAVFTVWLCEYSLRHGFGYLIVFVAVVLAAAGVAHGLERRKRTPNPEGALTDDIIRAVLPLVEWNRAELLYTNALYALEDRAALLDETTQADLLRHLNALLGNYRKVTARHRGIGKAAGAQNVTVLEEERVAIAERRDRTTDPEARETLESSLRLLETRLERANALLPLTERLDAQAEMICQALASTGEALRALRLVPASASVAAPDVAEIEAVVARVNRQTQAVE